MISHKLSSYLSVTILICFFLAPLASCDMLWQDCVDNWNYTVNSTYQSNLKHLSTTLPKKASSSPTLFATDSAGTVPDTVYALTLCRGDANASICAACVTNAFQDAQQVCAYSMDVTVYYDPCYLRFSNQNFMASVINSKQHIMPNGENATSPAAAFDSAVGVLLNAVVDYAVLNSSSRFGTGVEDFDKSNPSIYALAQCTPDMSPDDCRACLDQIVKVMPKHFSGRQGGRILGLRCNYRFELYPPFSGSPILHLPAPGPVVTPSVDGGGSRIKSSTILAIALGIVSSALTFTLVCFCVWSRRKQQGLLPYLSNTESMQHINLLVLDLSILKVATENFADRNKLGEGGFGAVYKGTLPDGQQIAVKRLSQGSTQGIRELKNELVFVAKLHHKNLVRLVGVCLEEQEKVVVYEYMPNRSLDTILFDPEKSKDLDWGNRFKIICGIARGLQYVHEDSQLKIIHRDLKASNVLLDLDLNPKISDFGLARLFEEDQTRDVTNRVVGTFGYMAPEYAMRGHYSIKSDVFSFGVLVLEIITGRRNCGSYNSEESFDLLTLIWEHWTNGRILDIVDPFLSSFPEDQVLTCAQVGMLCVQENPTDRPTMSAVNVILSTDASSLQAPSKPAFCIREISTDPEQYQAVSRATRKPAVVTPNEVSLTELEPR
ncbi:cysteine-rich receptor-like protein kinase 6 [Phragmites australis]|uniref:cysteine-rich receptor-like protein kinase 6 n=1 Tax=Phragmites australis TaxID=29695 RepID=UPI002D79DC2B|nr:cysteine-rich receptor-like protein kinase 6 [Phragmites australis]